MSQCTTITRIGDELEILYRYSVLAVYAGGGGSIHLRAFERRSMSFVETNPRRPHSRQLGWRVPADLRPRRREATGICPGGAQGARRIWSQH
eukprot:scaffold21064_cov31-Tisochrysis_lutea.AAC.3